MKSHHTCFLTQHKRQGKIKKNIKLYILWNYFSFTIFETQSELKVKQCPYCSWLGEGGIQYIYRQETRCARRGCFLLPSSMWRVYPWRALIAQVSPMGQTLIRYRLPMAAFQQNARYVFSQRQKINIFLRIVKRRIFFRRLVKNVSVVFECPLCDLTCLRHTLKVHCCMPQPLEVVHFLKYCP